MRISHKMRKLFSFERIAVSDKRLQCRTSAKLACTRLRVEYKNLLETNDQQQLTG